MRLELGSISTDAFRCLSGDGIALDGRFEMFFSTSPGEYTDIIDFLPFPNTRGMAGIVAVNGAANCFRFYRSLACVMTRLCILEEGLFWVRLIIFLTVYEDPNEMGEFIMFRASCSFSFSSL